MNRSHRRIAFALGSLTALAGIVLLSSGDTKLKSPQAGPPTPAGPLPGGPLPKETTKLTSYLSNLFFRRVDELAAYFRSRGSNITGEDLLAVFFVESNGVRADISNSIKCLGLNQICPTLKPDKDPERVSGLRAVGFQGSISDYLALAPEDQLLYVRRFFDTKNAYRAIQDYGSLYLVNFSPAFLSPPNEGTPWFGRYPVMYRDPKRGGDKPLDGAYTLNAGVDTGNKGYIELADMAKFVKRGVEDPRSKPKWDELRMRLQREREKASV
jgi:hypothetical protein